MPRTVPSALQYSMTGDDMINLCPDARLIKYPQLDGLTHIDQAFIDEDGKEHTKLIILYLLTSPSSGHWVCLFRRPDGNGLTYFDSYGSPIDEPLEHLSDRDRIRVDEETDKLCSLLDNPSPCTFWNVRIQQSNTETCGMHVSHRLRHDDYTDPEYLHAMKNSCALKKCTPDELVASYCIPRLGLGSGYARGLRPRG